MTGTPDTHPETGTDTAGAPAKISPRSGARLAVVQALYEMDISGKGVLDALAEFEAFWIGQEVDGIAHPPAETAFFRDLLRGTVEEQRAIDPKLDQALAQGWPLRRIEIVLRAILRAGAYELMFRRDVPGGRGDLGIRRRGPQLLHGRRAGPRQRRPRPGRPRGPAGRGRGPEGLRQAGLVQAAPRQSCGWETVGREGLKPWPGRPAPPRRG